LRTIFRIFLVKTDQPHVSIIILNWNGARDTIECLETVLKNDYARFNTIIVDNNSQDESVEMIKSWAQGHEVEISTLFPHLIFPLIPKPVPVRSVMVEGEKTLSIHASEHPSSVLPIEPIVLIENKENVGFALGNNLGIETARALFGSDYYFILNNDTVIERDAVTRMIEVLETDRSIGAATSAIFHYSNRDKIANLGGKISVLATRNYYTKKKRGKVHRITFATGCALLVRQEVFEKLGLLSGSFFFGEEDFEFSWRLRKNNIPVVCVNDSKVYHKIGMSADKLSHTDIQKQFIYVFNRIIDMKLNLSVPLWQTWRFLLLGLTFIWLTAKQRTGMQAALQFISELRFYTNKYSDAGKATLDTVLEELSLN